MVIVWKVRGKNYQVCCVQYCVQRLCTVQCTHTWTDLTVLCIGSCLTGPISLWLDSFLDGVLLCVICMCRFPVSPSKLPLPMLASGPHVICGSLGPPESGTQMVTWSFQPFLQGSLVWHTDRDTERATDRPSYSVRCGVILRNYVGYGKANNFATINLWSRHVYVQNI